MKIRLLPLPACLLLCAAGHGTLLAAEQDEAILVTATRLATPASRIGSSISVITAAEIERRQYRSLGDALQSVPSLSVIRNGGAGKLTSIFSRGSNANHTLMLIDGIEINDPGNTDGRVDLSQILIADVERIEILHGPQSTLYGSDAIGAVIQVFTRKGAGKPVISGALEGGSFGTLNESVSAAGALDRFSYRANLQHTDTDGISALSSEFRQPNGVLDDDGNERLNLSGRLVYAPLETLEIDFSGRYTENDNDLDLNVFPVRDDSDSNSDSDQLFLGMNTRLSLLDGRTDHRLGITYSDIDRNSRDDFDPVNSADFLRDSNDGTKLKFELQNDLYLSDGHDLTLGVETEKDSIDSSLVSDSAFGAFNSGADEDTRSSAVYLQDQFITGERLSGTAGIRYDDHDDFGDKTTYRLALAYRLHGPGTRLRASYSTGFKAPTLFQLFGVSTSAFSPVPFTGNPNLKPETSKGWEAGFEHELQQHATRFGATYYRNRIEDLITFSDDFTTNVNRGEVETYGVDAFLTAAVTDQLTAKLNYSYTRAVDRQTDKNLRRRPLQKAVANLDFSPDEKLSFSVEGIFIGNRYDTGIHTGARVRRGSYFLTNLATSWKVDSRWELFGRIENLFDRDYREPDGFEQPGIGIYVGVKATHRVSG